MHTVRTEEGDESATETSTACDSESDDWSDTEDEEEEEEEAREREHVQKEGDNNSNVAGTTALTPCMAVTCSDTFALILKFCASNEIAGRFSSGALLYQ